MISRRGFLLRLLAAAGTGALAAIGIAARGARWTGQKLGIPVKPLDADRLRDPHDLAG